MADFDKAINVVFQMEGGFSDRETDRGGATNFGISLRFLKALGIKGGDLNLDGIIDIADIKHLNEDIAEDLYKQHFWDDYDYDEIASQAIATKLFDISVNCGPGVAARIAQNALNAMRAAKKLKVDGVFGPKTLQAINEADSTELLKQIRFFQKVYFLGVVAKFPEQKEYINGWLNRVELV